MKTKFLFLSIFGIMSLCAMTLPLSLTPSPPEDFSWTNQAMTKIHELTSDLVVRTQEYYTPDSSWDVNTWLMFFWFVVVQKILECRFVTTPRNF